MQAFYSYSYFNRALFLKGKLCYKGKFNLFIVENST